MSSLKEFLEKRPYVGWIVFFGSMLSTFLIGLFLASIMERRVESRYLFQIATPIKELEPDSAKWGVNFPRNYQRWLETKDSSFKSKHAGSAVRDTLEESPLIVVLWAGYPFSADYKQARGHFHAVEDVRETLRTTYPMPGTCWTCKSSDVPRLMQKMGIDAFYKTPWETLGAEIHHPVGCADCHNPKTMDLQITRPALIEAMQRRGIDVNNATPNEMRSLVCAQCHVEYYFKNKYYLTFPWDKGLKVEDIEAYYDEINHVDWVHSLSKTPMLKAQHPDWELFQASVHFKRGVSCADCHMPYRTEGGVKFTDHKIQSPLAEVHNSCQVCHGQDTQRLIEDVYERQDKVAELRKQAEKYIATAHLETKILLDNNVNDEEISTIQKLIRHAQWRWDFVAASIGGSFHAPLECARILSTAIDKAQQARLIIAKLFERYKINPPQIDLNLTKEQAQKLIGLNIEALHTKKAQQKKELFPKWDEYYKNTYLNKEETKK